MPTTQYIMDTKLSGIWSGVPCLLQGITIHENNLAGGDYYICDTVAEMIDNIVFVIRSIRGEAVKIAFPLPIYFSQGIYIEAAGGIPTITLELL